MRMKSGKCKHDGGGPGVGAAVEGEALSLDWRLGFVSFGTEEQAKTMRALYDLDQSSMLLRLYGELSQQAHLVRPTSSLRMLSLTPSLAFSPGRLQSQL